VIGLILFSATIISLRDYHVLERYRSKGGRVRMEMFEGSGHGPLFDAAERWSQVFFEFLASVEVPAAV